MSIANPYREIPYNYTSFSDREIVIRLLGSRAWELVEKLRARRDTGISSHMLLEILGDMWVVTRNPYIQDDLLENQNRRKSLIDTMIQRLDSIQERAKGNEDAEELVSHGRRSVENFRDWFSKYHDLRKKARSIFKSLTRKDNIMFDGLARVSHVTDATDWRVEMPFVVLTPDTEEEIAALVEACIEMGLTVIPRGGGTGYTGGAIPLDPMSAVINTEKLESLSAITQREGVSEKGGAVSVIRAGAGVVTRRVSDAAQMHGLVLILSISAMRSSTHIKSPINSPFVYFG